MPQPPAPPPHPAPDGAPPGVRTVALAPALVQALSAASVRLWRIDLHAPVAVDVRADLSPAEQARHDRLVFADDRARFAAAHGAVRRLIGAATGVAPQALVFGAGPHGKPFLDAPPALRRAAFNLSHGHDVGLLLWAPDGGDWGVDLERLRPLPDADAIADRVFTPAERAAWRASPPADRDRRFLVLWTRKEACLKAIGSGFAVEPHRFEAGLADGPCDTVLPTPDGGRARVRLADLAVGDDAVAAVARVWPGG